MDERLTKKQLKELKRTEDVAPPRDKTPFIVSGIILFIGTIMVGALLAGNSNPKNSNSTSSSEVVSEAGVHWDPTLAIFIKGQKQDLPANLGLTGGHSPIHVHANDGLIHFEYNAGPVTKDQLRLGAFFKLWDKPFSSEQIFDSKNGAEGKVSMLVNGKANTEYEKYQIKDKDKIEIRYE